MTRRFYRLLLWLHPPAFRRRFADEMLSIFDEGGSREFSFTLVLDALISFARQWLLRTDAWKILIALGGGFVQVLGFGLRTSSRQMWMQNRQALTPYMQEVILMTLALMCTLFVMVMSLTIWSMRFQRRRSLSRH